MKKTISLLTAVLLVMSLFTGCGASSVGYDSAPQEAPQANGWKNESYDAGAMEDVATESASGSQDIALPENQKLIITKHMDVETDDMDPLLAGINAKITELGGYIEAQEIYNGSNRRYRNAYLTVRIPAEKLGSFVSHVGEQSNVISESVESQNVTLTYVATESRIKALETEEARLLELLAMAENMEDLLLIEARLTEVRTELEQVTSMLRSLENQVSYSTIHLNINEVKEYTDTTEPETVWDRISSGFSENMKDMGEGLVDIFVFLVVAIPYLIPLAVIAGVIVVIILASQKKKKKKQPPQDQT